MEIRTVEVGRTKRAAVSSYVSKLHKFLLMFEPAQIPSYV